MRGGMIRNWKVGKWSSEDPQASRLRDGETGERYGEAKASRDGEREGLESCLSLDQEADP